MVLVDLTHVLPLELASTMRREPADSFPTAKLLPHTEDWLPLESHRGKVNRCLHCLQKVSSSESPKLPTSELVKPNPLVHSSSNISVQKQSKGDQPKEHQPKGDLSEDQGHLQGTLKILKGERSALQAQLAEKE